MIRYGQIVDIVSRHDERLAFVRIFRCIGADPMSQIPIVSMKEPKFAVISLAHVGNRIVLGTGKTGNIYVLGAAI